MSALTPELETALLGFDPRELTAFLIGGKPAPALLQALKRRGLCGRFRVPMRNYHRWELTNKGRDALSALRSLRGLPAYPIDAHHRDDLPAAKHSGDEHGR